MTLEGIVYDRDRAFTGFITDPVKVEVEPAWNARSIAQFTVASDHAYIDTFQAPGARVTFTLHGGNEFSGWIDSNDGELVAPGADITFFCVGDDAVLDDVLAFPAPQRPLTAATLSDLAQGVQTGALAAGTVDGQGGYFQWPSGSINSVEGAIKELLRANLVARLGLDYTILPDRGRGGRPILPEVRFLTLREAIAPLLAQTALGVRIWQPAGDSAVYIDVVEPDEWDQEITEDSGILVDGSGGYAAPTATRTVAGGPGDLAARVFQATTEGAARTATETRWGRVIETFRDATGLQLTWPDGLEERFRVPKYHHLRVPAEAAALRAYLNTEAMKDVTAGLASSSLEVSLTEGDEFAYGPDGARLGTLLHLRINGVAYDERITGARITLTADAGLTATPLLGARTKDPDQELMTAVVNLHRALQRRATQA